MYFETPNKNYEIIITYKNNRNMYLRVKPDLKVYITCSKRMPEKEIKAFISKNYNYILKAITKYETKRSDERFSFLGHKYEIVYVNTHDIYFGTDKVFVDKEFDLNKYLKKQAKEIFLKHLNDNYSLFQENIPYPQLKIRKMTSRWGVCNRVAKTVTLNSELIKLDSKYLDYVIIHELSHFIYPNHQENFWLLVSKYIPNYKQLRKEMRD